MGAGGAILNRAAQAALLIYEPPAEPAPYGRRRRHSKLRRASGAPYL